MNDWEVSFPLWNQLVRLSTKLARRVRIAVEGVTCVQGPVEDINGRITLRIPLDLGGSRLARSAKGISHVEGDCLIVTIPRPVADKLGLSDGTIVNVDNRTGRFNITIAEQQPDSSLQAESAIDP